MADQPAGALLDSLGVKLDLDEGDLIASTVVLAKVVKEDGTVTLAYGHSEGMCWIEGVGLITAGSDVVRRGYIDADDED
jgi:hypothetical protein